MNRHSFTYPQYCPVVDKNVIIEELTFLSGRKKIRCLYYHKCNCKEMGGCKNKYVKRRIEAVEKKEEWLYNYEKQLNVGAGFDSPEKASET